VFSLIGYEVGHAWGSINHGLTVATYILVAIVVIAIAGFVVYRLRQFRRESAQAAAAAAADGALAADGAPAGPEAATRSPGKHRSDAEI